jgi:hypothetical protein
VGLTSNGTRHLLFYADVNLLEGNTDTTKKTTQILIGANKEVDVEVNAEKTKYT